VHVLLVEDERTLAATVARGLQAEGFTVEVVHDGREAYWRARDQAYDAILLDVMLPGLNGYAVCARLRADGVTTPILMLTAKDGEYDEAEGLDTGADDYLTKPFSYVVLVARLRALARRGPTVRSAALTVGGLTLDPVEGTCSRDGRPVVLTSRERSLLELLLRRAGRVVSKDEALRQVWGYDFEGDPNIVEVYVGHLRRKLDKPFGAPMIRTLRGLGYRLEPPREG
jgi:DNA-binding response OmpR family regulator